MDEIIRLQKYLSLLRTTANWSVQEFADMLGVTRQTINNLEKKDPIKMSKVQYLAIRSLFTHEIENGNEVLGKLLYCLVDHPERITENDRAFIANQAKILSSAAKGGSTKEDIDESWAQIFGMIGGIVGAAIMPFAIEAGIEWLDVIMNKSKK